MTTMDFENLESTVNYQSFISRDGVDAAGVRAEVGVKKGSGYVATIEEGNGVANVSFKSTVPGIDRKVGGWVPMNEEVFAMAKQAMADKRPVEFRLESRRKNKIDRNVPMSELKKSPIDNLRSFLVGLNGHYTSEMVTLPEEDITTVKGAVKATSKDSGTKISSRPSKILRNTLPTLLFVREQVPEHLRGALVKPGHGLTPEERVVVWNTGRLAIGMFDVVRVVLERVGLKGEDPLISDGAVSLRGAMFDSVRNDCKIPDSLWTDLSDQQLREWKNKLFAAVNGAATLMFMLNSGSPAAFNPPSLHGLEPQQVQEGTEAKGGNKKQAKAFADALNEANIDLNNGAKVLQHFFGVANFAGLSTELANVLVDALCGADKKLALQSAVLESGGSLDTPKQNNQQNEGEENVNH